MKKNTPRSLATFTALLALGFTAVAAENATLPPDNSQKNERDRSGETKTAGDQSNRPEDIKTTAAIRRAIVKDGSLSMLAKNVKIITTADGQVTLRGPVKTAQEKSKIGSLATAAAGKAKVNNQLEVKNEKAEKAATN